MEKRVVISNGFDLDTFKPIPEDRELIRAELGFSADHFLVGMFGRFHPVKDFPTLFQAVQMISASFPKMRLVIAGDGINLNNQELMTMIASAGLSNITAVLGTRSDMPRIYRAIDLMAMTSISETGPLVIGEAMASGVPCIATNVGICKKIIKNTGWIVSIGSPMEVAAALRQAIEMDPSQMKSIRERSRKIIEDQWSAARMTQSYSDLYSKH